MSIQLAFNQSVSRIFQRAALPKNIAIALSGGVDSICLTHLLNNYVKSNSASTTIYPITINHNLRNTSSMEIPIIRKQLSKLGLDDTYLTRSISLDFNKESSSFEEVARLERYRVLTRLCQEHAIDHLFLAHHLDDQLETFILRLFSNSGVLGLSGMKPLTKSFINVSPKRLNLVRPMLDITKNEILKHCLDNRLEWVQDYTNFEEINQRNIVRKFLQNNTKIKNDVLHEFNKCQDVSKDVEQKVSLIHKILIDEDRLKLGTTEIFVQFKNQEPSGNWDLVISRFLFKLAYPLSPSPNYHYSFHKLQKKLSTITDSSTFSLLQLQWHFQFVENGLRISIKRQNLKTPIEQTIRIDAESETEWILFDNRFWFKISNPSSNPIWYCLKTLSKSDKYLFRDNLKDYKYSKYANLPILIDPTKDKIISIPTVTTDPNVQVVLKENIYTF